MFVAANIDFFSPPQNGEYGAVFKYGMVNEELQGLQDMSKHYVMLKDFLKDLKCAPALAKLFDNHKTLIEANTASAVRRRDRFNVLCHGDMWSNNVMFRYSESGDVEECMLVDFQMGFYSSPMLDLHYFIVNSLSHEDKTSQVDHIVYLYHKQLAKNLRSLGYKGKIPSLLELQQDFLETGGFGVFTLISVLPVITAPSSDDSTLDNLTSQSESDQSLVIKRRMYTNPIFTQSLEELIPYYERKGYLEL